MGQSGDITEITFNNDVTGSFTIFCKSNESGTLEKGGPRVNDDDNAVTGNGISLTQLNYRKGSFESPPVDWDMTDQDAQSKLEEATERGIQSKITIASITGVIFGGLGIPVGDLPGDTNTGLITLKIAFSGKVKKIA